MQLQEFFFDGKQPLVIIGSLTDLSDELDEPGLSEQEAYKIWPKFLSGDAKKLFNSSVTAAQGSTLSVSSWPSVCAYTTVAPGD